mmetsp:Transcript_56130/g.144502  ORF Transcript_56130/g.144502 Transcript_56130/m.144502 type:complete len:452 (-) Transcript_56130:318-1673(-)
METQTTLSESSSADASIVSNQVELNDSLKKACSAGKVDEVSALLKAKANVNCKYAHGLTPLHFASLHNRPEAVRVLRAAGAKPEAETTDEAKATPWALAVVEGHEAVMEALLEEPEPQDPIKRRYLGPCLLAAFVFMNLAIVFLLLDEQTRWVGWQEAMRPQASASWHRDVAVALSFCFLTCLALVNMLDPGAVCQDEVDYVHQLRQLPSEMTVILDDHKFGVIHEDGSHDSFRWCVSCKLWRPRNVSHCSDCRRCLWRFDHHCYVIGNCVAEGNHRFFAPMLVFGAISWAIGIHGVVLHLWDHGAFSSTEPWERLGSDVAQWPLALAAVFIACGSCGCAVLLAFASFHMASLVFAFNTKMCWTKRPSQSLWPPRLQTGPELVRLWLGPVAWRACDPQGTLKSASPRRHMNRRDIMHADFAATNGRDASRGMSEGEEGLVSTRIWGKTLPE